MSSSRTHLKLCQTVLWGFAVCIASVDLCQPVRAQDTETKTEQPVDPPSAEQIGQWVAELDDNLFDTREKAQEELLTTGLIALDQVGKAADSGSLESSTRALNILLAWSESSWRPKLRMAALEKIIGLEGRPQESLLAGELLANAKEEAALVKVLEYGAHCSIDNQSRLTVIQLPGGVVRPLQVTIDRHWTGGTDGLQYLKELRRVATLSFHSAPLGEEIAPVLEELPQLKRIELYGMDIPQETIVEWRKRFPHAKIDPRRGAKLGIRGDENPGAIVRDVVAGTAAERAGLMANDHITHIDGKPVKDFRELTQQIAKHEANDSVMLKIRRQLGRGPKQKEMEVKVTFDQWGADKNSNGQITVKHGEDPSRVLTPLQINLDRR